MENNTFVSQELEDMRAQIAILKDKLDKQTIVNDTHIRNSMKSKRSEMTRTIGITIFAGVLAIPYCIGVFCYMGLSPVFIAATGLMLAVCVWLTIKQQLTLKGLDFSQCKLLEVAEKLNKVKVHYHEWIKIALPMLIIWFSWLMYEVITHCGIEEPMTMGFCVGAAIGGVVGGIVGYRTNRKIVRKSTEILEQIDEITRQ
jgi:hypothetical protein